MKKEHLIAAISFVLLAAILLNFYFPLQESFEDRRVKVLKELSSSIEDAVAQGKYHCCINPPCTMCYLGNWIWEDGTCNCDAMIAQGDFDKVCPQCVKAIEKGECESTESTLCEV